MGKIRRLLKNYKLFRKIYIYFLYVQHYLIYIYEKSLIPDRDKKLLEQLRKEVRAFYPLGLNLTAREYFHAGTNILGYPDMWHIEKDGKNIGAGEGKLIRNGLELKFLQCLTDIEFNFAKVTEAFQPTIVIDFGTGYGGSAIFYYECLSKYCEPKILSIDSSPDDLNSAQAFHERYKTKEKIKFINKHSLECLKDVKDFITEHRGDGRAMLVFDDNHSYQHTYNELKLFAPILNKGDVLWMQDTWTQDEFKFSTSPLLSVYRFLKENPDFTMDYNLLKQMQLPFNFMHGILIKTQ